MTAQFILGIDLGTTNSVLAYTPIAGERAEVQVLSIPQWTAPGTIESRGTLPSFVFLAHEHELNSRQPDVPWANGRNYAVGEWARRQAAESPDRTVGAAKSWLCHSRVDRHQALLPWGATDDAAARKISPVDATRYYLEHLIAVWEAAFPNAALRDQQVVLTVPASFDAAARELTREAALAAGFPENFVLLEEPQAAIYAWLDQMGDRWRKALAVGDQLLVCDVGGGTTDLTLVEVAEESGDLTLRRIAVGDHLLVGGDNMDLALAHTAATQFAAKGVHLDPWQSVSLWHSCRAAKETLLSGEGPSKHAVTVLGRGKKLIAATVSIELEREQVSGQLLDGFFPICEATDRPIRRRASGFQEIGLPFEADTSITKHIAGFLQAHGEPGKPIRPNQLLLNGGVFKAPLLRQRLLETLTSWTPAAAPPKLLAGEHDLDYAVARGAAFYGWTKNRGGVRIRGGTARSYYVGIESAGLAIPGAPRPLRALCVVPFGMEEGTEADVPSAEIGLIVGEPAQFRFFSSPVRKQDQPGTLLKEWTEEELSETDSLETTLPADGLDEETYVPVRFQSKVTELGMFELWCASTRADRRWKLEFNVREEAE
ncbi:MAG: Hsp70 family protein [Planctomycetota bacterium]